MNNEIKDKPFTEILRDTQHNSKAQQVFLKLLAKQKLGSNPFDKVRTETWNPSSETKPGEIPSDTN